MAASEPGNGGGLDLFLSGYEKVFRENFILWQKEGALSRYLSPGTIFSHRYRIERRIASGGMGDVYEVVHVETNRHHALKVLHRTLLNQPTLRARFRKEARLAAAIESEYIVDVSDAGVDDETHMPFLVMELLRGEDLNTRITRVGRLPAQETVDYLAQAAAALDKTHRAHIVHRDLKPENLFLSERADGPARVKLLDFGIAKALTEGTQTGQTTGAVGTPLYMAPEQFTIGGVPSPASDIYALGLISFTMLVGKSYWEEEACSTPVAIAFAVKVAQGPQESAGKRAARYASVTLPHAFDAWFARATAWSAENRYATAGEAVIELAKALDVPVPGILLGVDSRASVSVVMNNASPLKQVRHGNKGIVRAAVGVALATVLVVSVWATFRSAPDAPAANADIASASAPMTAPSPPGQTSLPLGQTAPAPSVSASAVEAAATAGPALRTTSTTPATKPVGSPKPKETGRQKHWSND